MLSPAISCRSVTPSLARAGDQPRPWPGYAAVERAQAQTATSDLPWDLLLACVAGYILTCVGRVHQLFPMLQVVRAALLTGLLAVVLYVLDRHPQRRSGLVCEGTPKRSTALLPLGLLSCPWATCFADGR